MLECGEVLIPCPNTGCAWHGKRDKCPDHVIYRCGYGDVQCKYCPEAVRYNRMESHLANECINFKHATEVSQRMGLELAQAKKRLRDLEEKSAAASVAHRDAQAIQEAIYICIYISAGPLWANRLRSILFQTSSLTSFQCFASL